MRLGRLGNTAVSRITVKINVFGSHGTAANAGLLTTALHLIAKE